VKREGVRREGGSIGNLVAYGSQSYYFVIPAKAGIQRLVIDKDHLTLKLSFMSYRERIMIEPGKRGGKPCIRGLRITVYDILE